MIVKDEAHCLARCLESVQARVDEIIVVDTGSRDETVSIAKRFGAKVHHHPWENNFSKHRNQSLAYASGDWILQLDADEALVSGSGAILRDTVCKATADYYYCQFYDMDKHDSVRSVYNLIRLFRNNMGMIFTEKVHNQLHTRGSGDFCGIRVNHYGYDLSKEKMTQKFMRTTGLLKEVLAANPEDAYSRHQLAASYSMHGDYARAINHGQKALDLLREKKQLYDFYITTFYLVAQAYYALEDLETAEQICLEALTYFDQHLDIHHILAAIYFRRQSYQQCRAMSFAYLDIYAQIEKDPALIGSGSIYCFSRPKRSEIFMGLACTFFIDKDFQTADQYFYQAFDDGDNKMQLSENIYNFYIEQQMQTSAQPWLVRAFEAGRAQGQESPIFKYQPEQYLNLADYYLLQNLPDPAQACIQSIVRNPLPQDDILRKHLVQIRIYWAQNAIEEMLRELETLLARLGLQADGCLNSFEDLARLIHDTATLLAKQQQWQLAETALKLAVQIAPAAIEPQHFQQILATAEQQ